VAGEGMERIGQTAVLGELLAGVLIGPGVLGLVREPKGCTLSLSSAF
jgi:Kef-type K+ transport system membrane component KefB